MEIKDVEALAELAKIELTQEEKERLLHDMDGILAYVAEIKEIDVPEVEPVYNHRNIWREDEIDTEKYFSLEIITDQFPDSEGGFVKVKKIL